MQALTAPHSHTRLGGLGPDSDKAEGKIVQGKAEVFYRREHADKHPVLGVDDIDVLIYTLLASSELENMAILYSLDRPLLEYGNPDHELRVGVDKDLQVGILAFIDEMGNFVSLDNGKGRGVVTYSLDGEGKDFPECSEVPIVLVRQALKEFLTSRGQRPSCVRWQDW